MYDVLDQVAKPLIPVVPAEQLGVVRFRDYERNILRGPRGLNQPGWIEAIEDHLKESLDIEGPTMDDLIRVAQDVQDNGMVVSVRRLLRVLDGKRKKSATEHTLWRRLRAIKSKGGSGFLVDDGFDLDQFFSRSMIFELREASQKMRRLVYGDHYCYLLHGTKALDSWRLRRVLMYHQASVLLSTVGNEDSVFKTMITQGRNFGLGLVLADQTPQKQDGFARSNIGLKCFLRQDDEEGVLKHRKAMGLYDEQINYMLNLPKLRMIVKHPHIKFPFEVEVPTLHEGVSIRESN